jgi:hypothetical protein
MAINLASIAKSLRAEEKALEQRLARVRKAIAAFVGFDGRSAGRKKSKHSAKSKRAISAAKKKWWRDKKKALKAAG